MALCGANCVSESSLHFYGLPTNHHCFRRERIWLQSTISSVYISRFQLSKGTDVTRSKVSPGKVSDLAMFSGHYNLSQKNCALRSLKAVCSSVRGDARQETGPIIRAIWIASANISAAARGYQKAKLHAGSAWVQGDGRLSLWYQTRSVVFSGQRNVFDYFVLFYWCHRCCEC
jgi:hypothetical protein